MDNIEGEVAEILKNYEIKIGLRDPDPPSTPPKQEIPTEKKENSNEKVLD